MHEPWSANTAITLGHIDKITCCTCVCVAGDITKAFLQVELHTEDRDAFIEMMMELKLTTDFVDCHLVVKDHLSYLMMIREKS